MAYLYQLVWRLVLRFRRWRDGRRLKAQHPMDVLGPSRIERPAFQPPKTPMHWSPDQSGYPLCGAPILQPWTAEFPYTTCEACKTLGQAMHVQHMANFR